MDRIIIDFSNSKGMISPLIYGHFSEQIGGVFYDGLWVGENSHVENIGGFRKKLIESLKKITPPVLRWPGGCFAETYDWRDGIGPRNQRPKRVSWWYSHDGRIESNQVGTHEFNHLCRLIGAEPYLAANMTSVTPLHIRNWIEYCNFEAGMTTLADERAANGDPEPFRVQYWGIGNENWGGGGQMTPEMCANEFIRFTTIMKGLDIRHLKLIISGANGHDLDWTCRLMNEWKKRSWHEVPMWGMSLHYYTNAFGPFDDLVIHDEADWYDELFRANYMCKIVDDHRAVLDQTDPDRKIKLVVDEWGNWHKGGTGPSKGRNLFEQQSNMRDAVVAALTLNIFNNRCDVVGMANIAQLCNNLHSLYLAGGNQFVETPNYYVFDMYRRHMNGKQMKTTVISETIEKQDYDPMQTLSVSASIKEDIITVTMVNLDLTTSKTISIQGATRKIQGKGRLKVLSHRDPNTCNTFDDPYAIIPTERAVAFTEEESITLPAASVAVLTLQLDDA